MKYLGAKTSGASTPAKFILALAGWLGAISAHADTSIGYRFVDLGVLEGATTSHAYAINELGQVVGESGGHAVLWSQGQTIDLGLGSARAINNTGQIVGVNDGHAMLWSGGQTTDLGVGTALGINDVGQIVGEQNRKAVVWNGTTVTELPLFPSPYANDSVARDINNAGQIVGTSYGTAVLWRGNEVIQLEPEGPETQNHYYQTAAFAINDRGQIIGFGQGSSSTSHTVPTMWTVDGQKTVLEMAPIDSVHWDNSMPLGINNHGVAVGDLREEAVDEALLWNGTHLTILRTLVDINHDLFPALATGINDAGWISGNLLQDYQTDPRAFVLIPVPEPGTYALTLTGLLALGWVIRRGQGKLTH